jgi:beta-lactamase class A
MASNSTNPRRTNSNSRSRKPSRHNQARQIDRSVWLFILLVRASICGLGASAIAGTAMSIVNPPKTPLASDIAPPPKPLPIPLDNLQQTTASLELTNRLQAATKTKIKLDASYIFVNSDSGEYSQLGADRVLPAASTIKLPILIALFQDVDLGKVKLSEQLTIDQKSIAGGSGDLQEQKPGTQVSILVAATKTIAISDNTATNLLIRRLGGAAALNQRFRNWGLQATTLNRPLPDLDGKNVTTARELARLVRAIEIADRAPQGRKIVSDASRLHLLQMMSNTTRNTMLPQGLGAGAKIAHKTGDIGSLIADVGSIELPSGRKYIAAVLVNRPYNDPTGPELVRTMSRIAYEYFHVPTPITNPQPNSNSQLPAPRSPLPAPNSQLPTPH